MKMILRNTILSVVIKRIHYPLKCNALFSTCEAAVHSPTTVWGFVPVLLAQMEDANFKSFMSGAGRWLVLVGALLLISAVAAAIVILKFRPGRRRHRHHRHRHRHSQTAEPNITPSESGHRHHRHRRRRHGHVEYPMNPTLAESGGLPPIRPDDQPPKF